MNTKCPICGNEVIKDKYHPNKKYCKRSCYTQSTEYKESHSKTNKNDYKKNKERYRELNKKWLKENKDWNTKRKVDYKRKKYQTDERYATMDRLRALVFAGLKNYSSNGKVKPSATYGINYKKILEHLGPKPGSEYEIDHVIPLATFDLNKKDQVKLAFAPSNHQWVHKDYNREKSAKTPLFFL